MKYLAIKNWHKYQSADLTQYCPWIRTYVNKDQDYGFSHLTMLQRYLLEGCCRLRSRVGHNIPNDPQWIARALMILPQERRFVRNAIRAIIASGFLIPTDHEEEDPMEMPPDANAAQFAATA
jgi:hypothetical protein